jgi:hypothetical protein
VSLTLRFAKKLSKNLKRTNQVSVTRHCKRRFQEFLKTKPHNHETPALLRLPGKEEDTKTQCRPKDRHFGQKTLIGFDNDADV